MGLGELEDGLSWTKRIGGGSGEGSMDSLEIGQGHGRKLAARVSVRTPSLLVAIQECGQGRPCIEG